MSLLLLFVSLPPSPRFGVSCLRPKQCSVGLVDRTLCLHIAWPSHAPCTTQIDPRLIVNVMAGSHVGSMIVATVAIIQEPGSSHPRFKPPIFFFICTCLLILPLLTLIYIESYHLKKYKHLRSPRHRRQRQLSEYGSLSLIFLHFSTARTKKNPQFWNASRPEP